MLDYFCRVVILYDSFLNSTIYNASLRSISLLIFYVRGNTSTGSTNCETRNMILCSQKDQRDCSFHFTWSWFWKNHFDHFDWFKHCLENLKVAIFNIPIAVHRSHPYSSEFRKSNLYTFWQDLRIVTLDFFSPLYLQKQSKNIWGSSLFYVKSVSILHNMLSDLSQFKRKL